MCINGKGNTKKVGCVFVNSHVKLSLWIVEFMIVMENRIIRELKTWFIMYNIIGHPSPWSFLREGHNNGHNIVIKFGEKTFNCLEFQFAPNVNYKYLRPRCFSRLFLVSCDYNDGYMGRRLSLDCSVGENLKESVVLFKYGWVKWYILFHLSHRNQQFQRKRPNPSFFSKHLTRHYLSVSAWHDKGGFPIGAHPSSRFEFLWVGFREVGLIIGLSFYFTSCQHAMFNNMYFILYSHYKSM